MGERFKIQWAESEEHGYLKSNGVAGWDNPLTDCEKSEMFDRDC